MSRSPRTRSLRRRSGGFTLVEVCAAIALLTVIVGAMLTSQAAALDVTRGALDTDIATADLQAAMEELLLTPLEDIPDPAGPYPSGVPIAKWTELHLRDETIVATYPNMVGLTVPDPLEVLLTIRWTDQRGEERTLDLSTARTR